MDKYELLTASKIDQRKQGGENVKHELDYIYINML